ncbi:hypothetical protein BO83DRAFT_171916 [Aspergillus eucalypticola CBS 122712]|uniref:Uncharacterized protein n=1 Tax=Aspergillus eucalypticola (strain CBS 122712 / IBT 29274) TaxID=1448314 RepID=A0A317W7I4_ASPEC|nr:uncharacterized protein BO83DRAFT_171916 [Aspergillus eucalypticola CBS 122712]PWY81212.1 hypothetical protein BO83DRAFT_171916 [Aspergillus eucalypticola CBS 122712]
MFSHKSIMKGKTKPTGMGTPTVMHPRHRTRNVSTQGRFSCPDRAPHSGYRLAEERWGEKKGPLNSLASAPDPVKIKQTSKYPVSTV